MRRLYLACFDAIRLLLCASLLSCHAARAPYQPVDRPTTVIPLLDSSVLALAEEVVIAAPRIARVWPGYFAPPAFALYQRDRVVLLHTPSVPPEGFTPLRGTSVPPALSRNTYVYNGTWPGLRGGVMPVDPNAPILAMAVEMGRTRPSTDLEFLLHENFHGWQVRHFADFLSEVPQRLPDGVPLPPSFNVALARERALLIDVVRSAGDLRNVYLREYLEARQKRSSTAAPVVAVMECRQERLEGTAEYVGLAGALAASAHSQQHLPDSLQARLRRWNVPNASPQEALRAGAYVVGATLTYLLQQSGADWRPAFNRGECLHTLVERVILRPQGP